jgi:hypothetical protein
MRNEFPGVEAKSLPRRDYVGDVELRNVEVVGDARASVAKQSIGAVISGTPEPAIRFSRKPNCPDSLTSR